MRPRLALRYAAGVASLRRRDVLVASFPRSGSTLLRLVVEHDARLAAGVDGTAGFGALNAAQPELGADWLWPRPVAARVVKTHRPFAGVLARPRAALVVRRPLDAVASYHTYWTSRAGAAPVPLAAFLRDARRGLPRWIRHTASWMPRAEVVVRFEALRADPAVAAAGVLRLAGPPIDLERLARAAALADARHVRRAQAEAGAGGSDAFGPGFVFARDTPAGAGAARFSDADRAWAEVLLAHSGLLDALPGLL